MVTLRESIRDWNAADPAWIAREGAIPETEDGGERCFPDGSASVRCTSWAVYARRVYGARVALFGFFLEENPVATGLGEHADGHDFALLDGRYLIDGWRTAWAGLPGDPILDLEKPSHAEEIRAFYGDPGLWVPLIDLERDLDREGEDAFERAMRGVAPVRPGQDPEPF